MHSRSTRHVERSRAPRAETHKSAGQSPCVPVRIQRRCACGGGCPRCAAPKETPAGVTLDPSVWQSGQPLTPSLGARMAAGFAQPVSHLRLHTDARAAHLADALGAQAFTAGSHIFFGAGESPEDLGLMAHETAHALQQPVGTPIGALRVGQSDSTYERMADHAASAILAGGSASAGADAPAHIARKKKRGLFDWAAEKLENPGEFIEAVVEHPFDATVGDASGAFAEGIKQDVKVAKELGSDALGAMRKNAEMVRAGGDSVESWLVKNQKKGAASMYADAKSNDTPVLGSLLGANAWVADQTGQAGTGILGGAVTMGSGLLAAAANPVDAGLGLLKLGGEVANVANPISYASSAASKYAATGDASSFNPLAKGTAIGGAWDALSKPYARAIDEDRYSEAGGRLFFDVVSTLLGGRANPAGKGSRTAPLVDAGADVAKALPADDLAKTLPAGDDLARTLPAGDDLAKTLTPIEAGKTLPQSPRQPYPTLNMPGAQRPHRLTDYVDWWDDALPKTPDRPVIDFPSGPFSPAEAVDIAKKKLGVKFPWDPPSPTAVGDTLPAIGPQPKPTLPTGSGPAFADTQRVPQPAANPPLPSSTTEVLSALQGRGVVRPQYGAFHQEIWEYLGGTGPAPISYRRGNRWFIDGERAPAYLRDLVEDQMGGGR